MNSIMGIKNVNYEISTSSIGNYYFDNVALSIQTICQIRKFKITIRL